MFETLHVAGGGHLALHFEPQPFQFGNRRQCLRAGEAAQELFAIGILRADDRLLHHVRGIARDLTRYAEQFAEVTFALLQQRRDLVDFLFVVVELCRQRFAACFRGGLRFLGFGQYATPVGTVRGEVF